MGKHTRRLCASPREAPARVHAAGRRVNIQGHARLGNGGADVVLSSSPAEFAAFMKAQNAHYEKLVRQIGAVAE